MHGLNMPHKLITVTKIFLTSQTLIVSTRPHLQQMTLHMDCVLFVPQIKLVIADVADVDLSLALCVGMEGEVLPH